MRRIKDIWQIGLRLTEGLPLCVVLCTLCLSACTVERGTVGDGMVPIRLTASMVRSGTGGGTRAATDVQSGALQVGDRFVAYFSGSDVTVSRTAYTVVAHPVTPSILVGTPETQPYFYFEGTTTTAYAYRGTDAASGSEVTDATTTFSVDADQTDDGKYKSSDLLYATTGELVKNQTGVTGELTFSHVMSKLVVSVTASSQAGNIRAVRIIGGSRTVSLSQPTCTLGATVASGQLSASNAITLYTGSSSSVTCAGVFPPQTVSGEFLQVETDAGTVAYTLYNAPFASGQTYTVRLSVSATEIAMGTVRIDDWQSDDAYTVVIHDYDQPDHAPAAIEAVDLGLPNGTLWANMNVGASTVTDRGSLFAWGETVAKTSFSWDNYWWGTDAALTKYNSSDKKLRLDKSDDAAYMTWGGHWRMPTETECQELLDNCTWAWQSDYNGSVNRGSLMTGPSGNTIFLPANSIPSGSSTYDNAYFWASEIGKPTDNPAGAKLMYVFAGGSKAISRNTRYLGLAVRPVYDPCPDGKFLSSSSVMVGDIICSHGRAHAPTTGDLACGGKKVAVVAYLGDGDSGDATYNHGLAISLNNVSVTGLPWCDVATEICVQTNNQYAMTGISLTDGLVGHATHIHAPAVAARNYQYVASISAGAHPSGTSAWFLGSMGQYNVIAKALAGTTTDLPVNNGIEEFAADRVNARIVAAGGNGFVAGGDYYSSTEAVATAIMTYVFRADGGWFGWSNKTVTYYIRPVLAF